MTMHASQCQAVGVSFVSLVIESLGGWSDLAFPALVVSWVSGWASSHLTLSIMFQRCAISFRRCIFLSVDVGIRQKICSWKLHSSGGHCVSGSGMCI